MSHPQRALLFAQVGVLVAAFALRIEHLGAQSLWYDEAVSVYLATKSLVALIAHTARDIHPPLYYILLHYWTLLSGSSEFTAAAFSLWWGVALVASTMTFARWLGGPYIGLVTAALVTLSPFNIWYSQEVRMYTLGATLGVWTLMALWKLLHESRMRKRWMSLWLFSATAGLYTLYYFAFLLLWEALFVAWWLWRTRASRAAIRKWLLLGLAVLLLWLPWLPVAVRQVIHPPVPPWREGTPFVTALLESLSALSFGQSMAYHSLWPTLAFLGLLFVVGLYVGWREKRNGRALVFLLGALLLPFLILAGSSYSPTPLYHVRYLFTYSPVFYILLGIAFAGCVQLVQGRARLVGVTSTALVLLTPLLVLSGESLQRFWNDTQYAADDLRGGVNQIEARWRAEDVALLNAGYIYPALNLYFDDPISWQGRLTQWNGAISDEGLVVLQSGSIGGEASLGWGLQESDFYATTEEETRAALERVQQNGARLWQLRLYDTVTDPEGLIRAWLDKHALLFYDQLLTGESNSRVQGWYFPPLPSDKPDRLLSSRFMGPNGEPWIELEGIDRWRDPVTGGSWVDLTLWLEGLSAMDPATRLSLGLYDTSPARRQWSTADEQPLGPLLSLKDVEGVQRWPVRLHLPQGLPPGKYEALLKFYRPSDGAVLRAEGERVVDAGTPEQVSVAVIEVGPTPPMEEAPEVGTPQQVRFGPLQFLGHAIPPGPWEPGASIPIELVWRKLAATEEGDPLRSFLTSEILASDTGSVTEQYPVEEWREGEVVRDIHYVTVAPDALPGAYPLYLRVSRGATPIPWREGLLGAGDILQIGELTVQDRERSFSPPAIATALDVGFNDSIQLVGTTLPDPTYQPGSEIPLTLHWHALGRPPGRYKIFTHLIGPDGNLRAQRDLEPGEGLLPTNGWARGEYVTTQYSLALPPDAPPGRYELRVGLYDPVTNERVQPHGANVNAEERYLSLGAIEVDEQP